MSKNKVIAYKENLKCIVGKELFYKYKSIEMYRLKTSEKDYLKYWFSIVFTNKNKKGEGEIIPCIDIRSFPGYEELIKQKGELVLTFFPDKIVPKLFFKALNMGLIKKNMCVKWEQD